MSVCANPRRRMCFNRQKTATNKHQRRTGLSGMELLDDRRLLAVTPLAAEPIVAPAQELPAQEVAKDDTRTTIHVESSRTGVMGRGTVNIPCGNWRNDSIAIYDLDGDGNVYIVCNGESSFTEGVSRLEVNVGSGSDIIRYYQLNHRGHENMQLDVDLGRGNDHFEAHVLHDIRHGHSLDIDVDGGSGRDQIRVIADADVYISPGSRLEVDLSGGSWSDTLWFSYDGEMDGTLLATLRGNSGLNDVINIVANHDPGSSGYRWYIWQGDHLNISITSNLRSQDATGNDASAEVSLDDIDPRRIVPLHLFRNRNLHLHRQPDVIVCPPVNLRTRPSCRDRSCSRAIG